MQYESPVAFYASLVGQGVVDGRSLGVGRGIIESFEKTYGWYVDGFRSCGGRVVSVVGMERAEREVVAGLGGYMCGTHGSRFQGSEACDSTCVAWRKVVCPGKCGGFFCERNRVCDGSLGSVDGVAGRTVDGVGHAARCVDDACDECEAVGSVCGQSGRGNQSCGVESKVADAERCGSAEIGSVAVECNVVKSEVSRSAATVCDGVSSGAVGALGVAQGSVSCGDGNSLPVRGVNWERNRKNRQEKKNRKKNRQLSGIDWRARHSKVGGDRQGFFSGCDSQVQKDLRDSRAKLLIAENNRRLLEEEKKIQRVNSPQAIVQEMIRVTNMANKLKKQTTNQQIGGWAETVADSLTRSVAESAPSSVPSLESVGYGKSALRSSDGTEGSKDLLGESSGSKKSLRRIEYEAMIDFVEKKYDSMDFVIQEEYDDEMRKVRSKYCDVVYSVQDLEKKKILQEAALALCEQGIEAQKIDIAFEKFNIDFEY